MCGGLREVRGAKGATTPANLVFLSDFLPSIHHAPSLGGNCHVTPLREENFRRRPRNSDIRERFPLESLITTVSDYTILAVYGVKIIQQ